MLFFLFSLPVRFVCSLSFCVPSFLVRIAFAFCFLGCRNIGVVFVVSPLVSSVVGVVLRCLCMIEIPIRCWWPRVPALILGYAFALSALSCTLLFLGLFGPGILLLLLTGRCVL